MRFLSTGLGLQGSPASTSHRPNAGSGEALPYAGLARAKLSIGVPVYNGERFLRQTVESLLAQTFRDFELVISDNASTDGTESLARELAASDPRIVYHRHARNLGMAGNYNFLARRAEAPWFKWANCDDLCDPTFVERCLEALDRNPAAVLAYPRARFIDESGQVLSHIVDPGFPLDFEPAAARLRYVISAGHWVNAPLGVIRRDALLATSLMPPYPGGDYVLLAQLCLLGRFIEIGEPLLGRRLHEKASSQLRDARTVHRYVTGREGVSLPAWYRLRDDAKNLLASKLTLREKASLALHLLRLASWRRTVLGREAALAARVALGSWLPRRGE
jgi:glycosyltransferase involved in cell wall biosynthesis